MSSILLFSLCFETGSLLNLLFLLDWPGSGLPRSVFTNTRVTGSPSLGQLFNMGTGDWNSGPLFSQKAHSTLSHLYDPSYFSYHLAFVGAHL